MLKSIYFALILMISFFDLERFKINIQMRKVLNVKFSVIFIELIIICCIFFTKFENIAASSSQGTTFQDMVTYINNYTGVSVAMISLQILFSFIGLPFNKKILPFQLILQIVALFLYTCFILMRMQYQTISYIWGVFCLIPFLLQILSFISQILSNRRYNLLDSK